MFQRRHIKMKKILAALLIVLGFVLVYPLAEFQIDCPSAIKDIEGNTQCTMVKQIAWEITAAISLYHWDGISMTSIAMNPEAVCCYNETAYRYAPDETESKSIFPILTSIVIILIYNKRRVK